MTIKLTNTTLGLSIGGIIKPKTPKDAPFEVAEELGGRLIREGKATLVFGIDTADVDTVEDEKEGEVSPSSIPEYSEQSTKAVLQSIANDYGVEFSANATKQEMLNALDDFFANLEDE